MFQARSTLAAQRDTAISFDFTGALHGSTAREHFKQPLVDRFIYFDSYWNRRIE